MTFFRFRLSQIALQTLNDNYPLRKMPDPHALNYATPSPKPPSRLWILVRILIALPFAGYAIGYVITSCSALQRGDPGASLVGFLISLACAAIVVLVFKIPVHRHSKTTSPPEPQPGERK
jgi:hypothetical protein